MPATPWRWPGGSPRSRLSCSPSSFRRGLSPAPPPPEWPPNATVTGYWVLPLPDGWAPPHDLEAFLDAGPPPAYFGVGSMRTERMRSLVMTAIEGILAAGQRGVLSVPPGSVVDLPRDRFRLVEGIPHTWLLPRMSLVIHHGGAGTTGAAIRAGVPSVATPYTADQAFWARRVRGLGVGPAPVPAHRLTPKRIAAIIDEMVKGGGGGGGGGGLGWVVGGGGRYPHPPGFYRRGAAWGAAHAAWPVSAAW